MSDGVRKSKDSPGGAHKRNFNRGAKGKYRVSMKRGATSRSKSRR